MLPYVPFTLTPYASQVLARRRQKAQRDEAADNEGISRSDSVSMASSSSFSSSAAAAAAAGGGRGFSTAPPLAKPLSSSRGGTGAAPALTHAHTQAHTQAQGRAAQKDDVEVSRVERQLALPAGLDIGSLPLSFLVLCLSSFISSLPLNPTYITTRSTYP